MATLLEMYESFHNGQKKQFVRQVEEYGTADFIKDMHTEMRDGVLTQEEVNAMTLTLVNLGAIV